MSNNENEFAKELMREWIQLEKLSKSSNLYDLQTEKFEQVNDLIAICMDFAETHPEKCRFRHYSLSPTYGFSGSVSLAISSEFNIGESKDDISKFISILSHCDGFIVEPFGDEEVFFTFFVHNLWKPKQ